MPAVVTAYPQTESPERKFEKLVEELQAIEFRRFESARFRTPRDAARYREIQSQLEELLTMRLPAQEHRQFVRIPCDLWVTVHIEPHTKPGIIDNIGAGGFFVSTTIPAEVGDAIEVSIEGKPRIQLVGRVVWKGSQDHYGLGVEVSAEDRSSRALRRFVINLLRTLAPDRSDQRQNGGG